jgi:hypothetical protein
MLETINCYLYADLFKDFLISHKSIYFFISTNSLFTVSSFAIHTFRGSENTVELGYNDHGYNEFKGITNKILRNFCSQSVTLLHKASPL